MKKAILFIICSFAIVYTMQGQTPDHLLKGTSSEVIPFESIKSTNRKIDKNLKQNKKTEENTQIQAKNGSSSNDVGTTPGQFDVSLSGAATYSIPILII